MAEEIIIQGKTLEEAMAEAQSKYNGDNVQFDILEMPRRGIFGIGASPAKIKVIINDVEDDEDTDLSGIVASIKGLGVTTNKGGGDEQPKENKQEKPAPARSEKPEKKQEKREKKEKHEKAPKAEKAKEAAAVKEEKPAVEEKKQEKPAKAQKAAPVVKEPKVIEVTEKELECALSFANTLLRDMGVNAEAKYAGSEPSGIGGNTYPHIEIVGEGAGILIGHHGETLDAIQYLVNLCAHRKGGSSSKEFVKIIVDIEDYRAKREETLRGLARRTAAKACKYKRNIVLEPMNPFERRIIHSEIQDIENVSTHSVGSDENRKIVVCYEGADKVQRRRRSNGKHKEQERGAEVSDVASGELLSAVDAVADSTVEL
ncbi:MAG: Jag N-terminal domain-containing protein [Clostridia bacterium]|nr:Jag N-terminal domain-containing protein [Clostridia bacterium]